MKIFKDTKDAGASDVHLTVGIPPKMRINGGLITMDEAISMLYFAGRIDREIAIQFAQDPDNIALKL